MVKLLLSEEANIARNWAGRATETQRPATATGAEVDGVIYVDALGASFYKTPQRDASLNTCQLIQLLFNRGQGGPLKRRALRHVEQSRESLILTLPGPKALRPPYTQASKKRANIPDRRRLVRG